MPDKSSPPGDKSAPANKTASAKDAFTPGAEQGKSAGDVLFLPEELDIYCDRMSGESYIFHGKKIDYPGIHYLEYDDDTYLIDVVKKDATRIDLGVKIQWLVRPYIKKAREISIVQTKDGESIDGIVVPIIHKGDPVPPKDGR